MGGRIWQQSVKEALHIEERGGENCPISGPRREGVKIRQPFDVEQFKKIVKGIKLQSGYNSNVEGREH